VGEVVFEVGQLHDPGEPSRRSRRVRDPADVQLVGLLRGVRQKLERLPLGRREALAAQLPLRGGTEL
jgi:hypothetical protein